MIKVAEAYNFMRQHVKSMEKEIAEGNVFEVAILSMRIKDLAEQINRFANEERDSVYVDGNALSERGSDDFVSDDPDVDYETAQLYGQGKISAVPQGWDKVGEMEIAEETYHVPLLQIAAHDMPCTGCRETIFKGQQFFEDQRQTMILCEPCATPEDRE